jgi:catechol-2,3-dioxygenase
MSHNPTTSGSAPRLHHLALRVTDVDHVASFYQSTFALAVVRDERPRALWLGLGGDAVLMIERREDDEPAPSPRSRELIALRVCAEHKAAIREQAVASGCFDGETDHTVYLRDPEGRRVGASTYPR